MTVSHIATGSKSAGGTSTISVGYPTEVRAGLLAIAGRAAWESTAQVNPDDETGWTNSGELFGGTGSSADNHTTGARADRKILDGSESGNVTFDQSGTPGTGGCLGIMLLYESLSGEFDTVETATGDDASHGANRSITASSNFELAPGDVVVAIVAVDTDTSLASFGSQAITASGITFGTTTRRTSGAGVTTGSDGNIEVFDATVSSGSGTTAPTVAFNTTTNQCGPAVFLKLRSLGRDAYWLSAFNTTTTPKDVVVPSCVTGDRLVVIALGDDGADSNNDVTDCTTTTQAGPGTTSAWSEYEEQLDPNGAQDWLSGSSADVTGDGDVTVRVARTQTGSAHTWGFAVIRRPSSGAIGSNGSTTSGSTEVVNLAVDSDAWVAFGSGAWDAGVPASTFTPSTGVIEILRFRDAVENSYQVLLWKGQSSGTRDYGSTNHASTNLRCVAVEIEAGAGGGATATPAVIAATVALPQPAVSVAAAPAVTAATVALPDAPVAVAAAPAVVPAVVALPDAPVSVGAAPAVVPVTVAVPQATPDVGGTPATATPAVIPAVVALPQAAVSVAAVPAAIVATVALPKPDVAVGAAPAVITGISALPQAAVSVGVAPAVIPVVVSLPQAIPDTGGGSALAQPTTIATTVALPQAVLSVGAAPAQITAVVNLPAAAVSVQATPAVIPVTVALPQATTPIHATQQPATITATVTIPAAAVSVGAAPATIPVTVTFYIPETGAQVNAQSTASVTAGRTSDPSVLAAVASVAAVTAASSTPSVSD